MNKKIAVVLADSARARFFTVRDKRGQGGKTEPALVEHLDLIQSGRRERPSEALTDSRPGTRQAGGTAHAVDDHRDARTEQGDKKFADDVMAELRRYCDEDKPEDVLIVAPSRFVGHLKAAKPPNTARFVNLELSELTAPRALEHLTKHGHLDLASSS